MFYNNFQQIQICANLKSYNLHEKSVSSSKVCQVSSGLGQVADL